MSLRLILFILALLVIAWIVWDHRRKEGKKNYYVEKKRTDANLLFVTNPKGLARDIDNEVLSDGEPQISKARVIATRGAAHSHVDAEHDPDFYDVPRDPTDPRDAEYQRSRPDDEIDMEFSTDIPKYDRSHDYHDDEDDEDPFADSSIQTRFEEPLPERMVNKSENIAPRAGTAAASPAPSVSAATRPKEYVINKSGVTEPMKQVFTLYVKAKASNSFRGDELLHGLLSVGCRFGEMNIFHRHEKTSGQGRVMFSVASMINPGVFDINNMQGAKVPGIVLFFTYPGTPSPSMVFDLMLKTAFKLAKHLDGEILDEERTSLTPNKTQQLRDKIELIEVNEFF